MLAAKFFDDQYFNNAYYAKVGGVPTVEVNALELEFLFSVNFSLHVATDVFEKYYSELANHMGVGAPHSDASASCECHRFAAAMRYHADEVRYTGMRAVEELPTSAPGTPLSAARPTEPVGGGGDSLLAPAGAAAVAGAGGGMAGLPVSAGNARGGGGGGETGMVEE